MFSRVDGKVTLVSDIPVSTRAVSTGMALSHDGKMAGGIKL